MSALFMVQVIKQFIVVFDISASMLGKAFRYVFTILSPRFFTCLILTCLYPISIRRLVEEGEGPSVDDIFITCLDLCQQLHGLHSLLYMLWFHKACFWLIMLGYLQ